MNLPRQAVESCPKAPNMESFAARPNSSATRPDISAPMRVLEVEPETVARWVADGEALLVDVRESDEYAEERIPGALLLPFSAFDAGSFPRVPCKKVVLVCLSGKRSLRAGARLAEAGSASPLALKGGMLAWSAAGLPTVAAAA